MADKLKISFWQIPLHHPSTLGKLISLFSFVCLIVALPLVLKLLWPFFLQYCTTQYVRHITVVLTVNLACFGTYNVVMYFIYKANMPFFQQYRCTNKQWPWESQPQQWKKQITKTMFLVTFNMLIMNPLMSLLEIPLGGIQYTYRTEDIPSSTTILCQFIFAMFVEDAFFYWGHRLLHHPSFYWIHKAHHEYNNSVTIAVTSAHPIQYFMDTFPAGIGLSLLSKHTEVHFVTMIIWLLFRVIETCEAHSGYEWSWSAWSFLPFKLDSNYHNFHHAHNAGNYGSMFGFWDYLMKTNIDYVQYAQKKSKLQ